MKRKQFIQTSGAALLGGMLLRNNTFASFTNLPKNQVIGLQLFTFFNIKFAFVLDQFFLVLICRFLIYFLDPTFANCNNF